MVFRWKIWKDMEFYSYISHRWWKQCCKLLCNSILWVVTTFKRNKFKINKRIFFYHPHIVSLVKYDKLRRINNNRNTIIQIHDGTMYICMNRRWRECTVNVMLMLFIWIVCMNISIRTTDCLSTTLAPVSVPGVNKTEIFSQMKFWNRKW